MTLSIKHLISPAITLGLVATAFTSTAMADWRQQYPVVSIGATTVENQAATISRFQPLADYFKEKMGVEMRG